MNLNPFHWFNNKKVEQRSELIVHNGGLSVGTDCGKEFESCFSGGNKSGTGVALTRETAFQIAAFAKVVQSISLDIASLGWKVFEPDGLNSTPAKKHPAYRLLNRKPNKEMTCQQWRSLMISNALVDGDSYSIIERAPITGKPTALLPVPFDAVKAGRKDGQLYYRITIDNQAKDFAAEDVFHLNSGFTTNGLDGVSGLQLGKQILSIALAALKFNSRFYAAGCTATGVLTSASKISPEQHKQFKDGWRNKFSTVENAFEPIILQPGWEFKPNNVTPEQAQFLEGRRFSNLEIANMLNFPAYKLDPSLATGKTNEQMGIEYYTSCLKPWIVALEQEADTKLLTDDELDEDYFTRINFAALVRGDTQSQVAFISAMKQWGYMTTNEGRELFDMSNVGPEGDKLYEPLNMQQMGGDPANEPPPPAAATGAKPSEIDSDATGGAIESEDTRALGNALPANEQLGLVIRQAAEQLNRRECKAVAAEFKKGNHEAFADWAQDWYLTNQLPKVAKSFGEVRAAEYIKNRLDTLLETLCNGSVKELLTKWETNCELSR